MARIERILDFLRTDPSADELAELLVLSDLTRPNPLACAIYLPDKTGVFIRAGQFGFEPWSLEQANDEWSILTSRLQGIRSLARGIPIHQQIEPLIEEAERLGYKTAWKTGVESAWLIPLVGRVGPIGVIALYMPEGALERNSDDGKGGSLRFEVLAAAVATLIQGESIRNFRNEDNSASISLLSERQERIVAQISRGASNSEIASQIGVSVSTVKSEISKILVELGASNRKDAVRKALEKVPNASRRRN